MTQYRRNVRKSSFIVGAIEAISLAIFAASIVINAQRDHSTVGFPAAQAIIYLLFAAGISLVTFGQLRGKSWSRTPYILFQLFAFIVAYTLISGTGTEARLTAVVISMLAMAGVYSAWRN